ncbi:SDR family NAD(P)-dependent oxidoreductase [Chelatococcus reniformis]|uniref:Beta-ketoacyl-ACP reductase n=1 Tax=Chelatococcus reniformis TaxID=1494448 RepID=A0A916UWX8_9HYPH|nr:SDR family oxidoreductase [Chelatococcus reniformis]GGC91919.1 beta-ketoacyl-ACP reductase [Chelatococcus reniformis]
MPTYGRLGARVALVTGAARGIGRATALKLADEGAHVVLNDVDAEPLAATARAVRDQGGQATILAADVTEPDFGERFVAAAMGACGRIDIIVANAGYGWNARLDRQTDEQWAVMIDTHATSSFRLVRAALPHLRGEDQVTAATGKPTHRKVVFVSSVAAVYGAPRMASYAAAKGALGGLTRSLAQELGPFAINVNAVAFGFTDTRLTRPVGPGETGEVEVGGRAQKLGYKAEGRDEPIGRIPLGRPGTAEEAAGAIWFLCLPESDYVTGQTLVASGGLYI